MTANTLYELLSIQARRAPEAPALLAPGRRPLTYGGLLAQVEYTVAQLNDFGVGRNDRVAVVLPSGPGLAAAFLGTASGATFAPLNPGYRAAEFEFYLADLQARALIVQAGSDLPAVAVALGQGIPVIELAPALEQPAGVFALRGDIRPRHALNGFAQADDVALMLHTSGTTASPKLVPRTHASLLASAGDYQPLLGLGPSSRCLNLNPLYHIQGLVVALLAPLFAGASVVCTPGFSPPHFFDWLAEFRPTWYSGGPSLHQAILDLALALGPALPAHSLHYIRSGSAPLPQPLSVELERVFNVPVLEGYGMTEVVPIASSPRPPRPRKRGSVGVAAGPEVAIMPEAGTTMLPPGVVGEIVVRGPSVMSGYTNNPDANARAFSEGWFRTGDLGYLDEDRYLFITGRLKEMINRGGEKIAPAEVEAVLLSHPRRGLVDPAARYLSSE